MNLFTRPLGVVTAALLLAGTANAATVLTSVYSTAVVSDTKTNFSTSLTIPAFDTSLGTLQAVYLTLYGTVTGTIQFENDDAEAATVTSNLGASIKLKRPDNSVLVVSLPVYTSSTMVDAFDGTDDYDGASGRTIAGVSAADNDSVTLTSASDMALFTSGSDLVATFSATGASSASGAGNLTTKFTTKAGGYATVQYAYDDTSAVPEPASWAMMVGGFGLLGGALRRKRTSTSVRFG